MLGKVTEELAAKYRVHRTTLWCWAKAEGNIIKAQVAKPKKKIANPCKYGQRSSSASVRSATPTEHKPSQTTTTATPEDRGDHKSRARNEYQIRYWHVRKVTEMSFWHYENRIATRRERREQWTSGPSPTSFYNAKRTPTAFKTHCGTLWYRARVQAARNHNALKFDVEKPVTSPPVNAVWLSGSVPSDVVNLDAGAAAKSVTPASYDDHDDLNRIILEFMNESTAVHLPSADTNALVTNRGACYGLATKQCERREKAISRTSFFKHKKSCKGIKVHGSWEVGAAHIQETCKAMSAYKEEMITADENTIFGERICLQILGLPHGKISCKGL
ncbi:uncharacterized protein PITG_16173 [Phytophthora infestans T30-4]|uniref:Uncharacterized protein n=1 Tax=Phytophthora infestans (strain T30-4) TaxID=403677 RepID=D0NTA9_PHYIT|nr:uncharacterized protein PITG_16173 [Phytophthora infestans T30-4]EEY64860.1 hypothetical protein PITG_16173 [Phytophthora infestans T30-4]|eukprot:XP_002897590.1 hypothetical protein PITG_16173 [Phytophthora infestans T30-4]